LIKYVYFPEITSTQKVLLEDLKKNRVEKNICYWSDYQTDGIGSRNNKWIGKKGNLFFSFVVDKNEFLDVPIQSFSIYFGWILKKLLNKFGSNVVLKWPNDIYLLENFPRKIGGIITNIVNENLVTGIGINTKFALNDEFGCLDIDIKNVKILEEFFNEVFEYKNFSKVIKEYKKEFEKTKDIFKIDGNLNYDGALIKNNKKVYSRR